MGEGRVSFWVFTDGLRHCEARRNAELSDGECYRSDQKHWHTYPCVLKTCHSVTNVFHAENIQTLECYNQVLSTLKTLH